MNLVSNHHFLTPKIMSCKSINPYRLITWLSFLPQGTENTDKSLKIAGFPKLEVFSYHWILFEKYSYSISKETLKSESLLKYVPELKLHKWGFNYKGKQTFKSKEFLSWQIFTISLTSNLKVESKENLTKGGFK